MSARQLCGIVDTLAGRPFLILAAGQGHEERDKQRSRDQGCVKGIDSLHELHLRLIALPEAGVHVWITLTSASQGPERPQHTGGPGGTSHPGQCLYRPTSPPMTSPMVVVFLSCDNILEHLVKLSNIQAAVCAV